ncbi:MAG: hypothetical protein WA705_12090 [Candidatus Ozemobacteraceae bacterium]
MNILRNDQTLTCQAILGPNPVQAENDKVGFAGQPGQVMIKLVSGDRTDRLGSEGFVEESLDEKQILRPIYIFPEFRKPRMPEVSPYTIGEVR